MSSGRSSRDELDFLEDPSIDVETRAFLRREYIKSLGFKYRAASSTPLNIPPLRAIPPDQWKAMEGFVIRPESGSGASSPGASPSSCDPTAREPSPDPQAGSSSPRVDPGELPDLSEDFSSEPDPMEVSSGLDEGRGPAGVDLIDADDLVLEAGTADANPISVQSPEGSEGVPAGHQGIEYGDDWESIPPPNPKHGSCQYVSEYFDGSSEMLAAFKRDYKIPEDVEITRPTDNRIHYREDQVTVPLMAITEGGLTLPFPRLLRQFLHVYGLAPHQLTTNVYRVICSVATLKRAHNLDFSLHDLMAVYTVARSPAYGRYYFTIRSEYPYLIDELSDSERHACELVVIKGNFTWGPEEEKVFPIPWRRGDPG